MSQLSNRAIVKNGRLVTAEPINLPDGTEVVFVAANDARTEASAEDAQRRIFASLARSYDSGQADLAERHNEHQP